MGLGASVHTCCRNERELEGCLSEWENVGLGISGSICDVSVRAQREELMETVSSVFDGKLNILVSKLFAFPHSHTYKHINMRVCVFICIMFPVSWPFGSYPVVIRSISLLICSLLTGRGNFLGLARR